ncbi:MAG TPA: PhoU domain-containing protein [Nitrososphaeraceae archaeon]|nr:PhoU domain-containing protein [Nitrososphaeraceae archaeon]
MSYHTVNTSSSSGSNNEVRRIQFTGRSTYILSLPKKWMNEMNLKAGDLVNIVRDTNHSLSIVPNSLRSADSVNEATAIITHVETENSLKRKVISMYLAGYNIMHLKAKSGRISPVQRDAIREVIRRNLVGTEIIADSSEIITVQVLLTLPELSINTAVRRMFLIATAMHKDAMSALSELNHELAEAVIKSDDEVDRFSLYILRNLVMATQNERALQEMGLKGIADCLSYRVAVKSIERVADHAVGMSSKNLRLNQKITKEAFDKIQKMSQLSLSVLSDSVEAFLRRDYVLADSVVAKAEDMHNLEADVISFLDRENTADGKSANLDIKIILEDIRRTAEHASDIAEAAMNQTIREVIQVRTVPQREKEKGIEATIP